MKSILISFFILLFISGCATAYQSLSYTGGFSETQLSENSFSVSFKGNGNTSRERASDFALLRSAEITLAHGYNFFIITDSEKYIQNTSYTSPKTYNTEFNATTYGNTTYGNANTTSSGGQTYNYSKPNITNIIICFKEKPNLNSMVYNAEFINKSIKTKYNIEK